MRLPLFFPNPTYVPKLPRRGALPLAEVCALAGVACRATGQWTERLVIVDSDEKVPQGAVWAEPSGGTVRIIVPAAYGRSARTRARYALGVLAYVLFDLVSRESIRGKDWAAISAPIGRSRAARGVLKGQIKLGPEFDEPLPAELFEREGRDYDSFLRQKVESGRASVSAGKGATNEKVEATYAARRARMHKSS